MNILIFFFPIAILVVVKVIVILFYVIYLFLCMHDSLFVLYQF